MVNLKKVGNRSKSRFYAIAILLMCFGFITWHSFPKLSVIYNYFKCTKVSKDFTNGELQAYVDLPFPDDVSMVKGYYLKDSIDYTIFLKFKENGFFLDEFCENLRKKKWVVNEEWGSQNPNRIKADFKNNLPKWWVLPERSVFFAQNANNDKMILFYKKDHAIFVILMDL